MEITWRVRTNIGRFSFKSARSETSVFNFYGAYEWEGNVMVMGGGKVKEISFFL